MASVLVTATAARDLRSLIDSHSLPASTNPRLQATLEPLREFPLLGAELAGRWAGHRFILGPWRWMLVVYSYDAQVDRVEVRTIQDGRSARRGRPVAALVGIPDLGTLEQNESKSGEPRGALALAGLWADVDDDLFDQIISDIYAARESDLGRPVELGEWKCSSIMR